MATATTTTSAAATLSFEETLMAGAEERSCCKCLKPPTEPYLLQPCLHTCCRACLPFVQKDGKCPMCCIAVVADEEKCLFNYYGAGMAEATRAKENPKNCKINCRMCKDDMPAVFHCEERRCRDSFLCADHMKRHDKNHKLTPMEAFIRSVTNETLAGHLRPTALCQHQEPYRFFCLECKELLCSDCCAAGPHQHHNRAGLNLAQADQRKDLNDALALMPALIDQLKAKIKKLADALDRVADTKEQSLQVLTVTYREIRAALDAQEKRDIECLNRHAEAQLALLKQELERTSCCLASMQRAATFGQQVAASPEALDPVALGGVIVRRIKTFSSDDWPVTVPVSGSLVYIANDEPLLQAIKTIGEVHDVPVGVESADGSPAAPGDEFVDASAVANPDVDVLVETTHCTKEQAQEVLKRHNGDLGSAAKEVLAP